MKNCSNAPGESVVNSFTGRSSALPCACTVPRGMWTKDPAGKRWLRPSISNASAGSQRYIEDCHVCCRPITVVLDVDTEGTVNVHAQSQDDV